MSWAALTRPRDPVLAARLAMGFIVTAALVQLGNVLLTPLHGGLAGEMRSFGIPLGFLLIAGVLRGCARRVPGPAWAMVPLLGLVAITVLDVTSRDANVEGQIFLFFPVLFAASQLPRPAAAVLTGLAMASECVVTFSSEPVRWAVFDSVYVGAGLAATSWLLVHSAAAQDRLIERLALLATVDSLTGLTTRRVLDEVADQALHQRPERRGAGSDHGTSLLVIDLDLFKVVNDTYGHPVGDDFLAHVGRVLRASCRPGDVISRLGGDEFGVLLLDCPYGAALDQGRRLVEVAAATPFVGADGLVLPVSLSVGVGHVPADTDAELRDLYALADRALYRAKELGRGRAA
ncbi:MAG TPA: GGDEF domain-containing protein [Kineosporiaceae bacterium]|nr:GGDEF domain-containing protein [Kineosporiaceae bacterium]